jgi:RNA polymerase sigma-70 factor, ECF subfamily
MLAASEAGSVRTLEGPLIGRDTEDPTQRVVRLAEGELDRAYRLAGLILGDQHEAQDATQDALLRAWRSAASMRDVGSFQAWFDRILVNVCRDRLRRRGRVKPIELADGVSNLADRDPFQAVLDRDEVVRAVASLEADLRIVILLHYWADLTLEGVAERVGWPVGTVKSRLNRALESMRVQLGSRPSGKDRQ